MIMMIVVVIIITKTIIIIIIIIIHGFVNNATENNFVEKINGYPPRNVYRLINSSILL